MRNQDSISHTVTDHTVHHRRHTQPLPLLPHKPPSRFLPRRFRAEVPRQQKETAHEEKLINCIERDNRADRAWRVVRRCIRPCAEATIGYSRVVSDYQGGQACAKIVEAMRALL